ncbi:DUF1016 domain-containing protein [Rhodococcus sp. HM1]|uniref:PDDEXK nuclease domain-containing protein n=1 Tax=Rhodococcus sp. HM1 TaxID=2937759 RepID=UPI00200AF2E8|nr:PDDEXK nuclease domain-containing protein [Rhodococcus sp. HM1]MCK8671039.1 DUF1016 domain-containing protein [Rhodococcus sp. HM1]
MLRPRTSAPCSNSGTPSWRSSSPRIRSRWNSLAIGGDASERELEERLVARIIDTLRELGRGFAFVGRQVHFDVDGDDFYVDLLFFHVEQLRYVVIELKTTKFDPRDAGQLGFYVALVEDRLRLHDIHQPTVGMLLVAEKNDTVVRYRYPVAVFPIRPDGIRPGRSPRRRDPHPRRPRSHRPRRSPRDTCRTLSPRP